MGKPSVAHLAMRELLTRLESWHAWVVAEEMKVAGHRIDFVVEMEWQGVTRRLGVDVNGDRWHRWKKIVDCDRVKLDRVFGPDSDTLVLGVWWSRLQSSPASVEEGILTGLMHGRLVWWDWAVPIESLHPVSGRRVASLVAAGPEPGWRPTSRGSGSSGETRGR